MFSLVTTIPPHLKMTIPGIQDYFTLFSYNTWHLPLMGCSYFMCNVTNSALKETAKSSMATSNRQP